MQTELQQIIELIKRNTKFNTSANLGQLVKYDKET